MPDDQPFDAIEIRAAERQVLVGGQRAPLGASVDDWLKAGERPSQAQVAALAFEGASVEVLLGGPGRSARRSRAARGANARGCGKCAGTRSAGRR